MYTDTNDITRNNSAIHENEEILPIGDELFTDQGMKYASKLLDSGY